MASKNTEEQAEQMTIHNPVNDKTNINPTPTCSHAKKKKNTEEAGGKSRLAQITIILSVAMKDDTTRGVQKETYVWCQMEIELYPEKRGFEPINIRVRTELRVHLDVCIRKNVIFFLPESKKFRCG
jgi:hypothetical protein